jgi:hypothetical protein
MHDSIRKLPYLEWENDLAWMEDMKGDKWNKMLKREKQLYNTLLKSPYVQKYYNEFIREFDSINELNKMEPYTLGHKAIHISIDSSSKLYWRWANSSKKTTCLNIDYYNNHVYYITVSPKHIYKYILVCEDIDGVVKWEKAGVSPDIAVKEGKCYYIKVTNVFRTTDACCCDSLTGRNEHILYTEKNPEHDLVYVRESGRTLYLKSEGILSETTWKIDKINIYEINIDSSFQTPLGESCSYIKMGNKYIQRGKPFSDWILPIGYPQWFNVNTGHMITIDNGKTDLWYCNANKKPYHIYGILGGDISPSIWDKWEDNIIQTFVIYTPTLPPHVICIPSVDPVHYIVGMPQISKSLHSVHIQHYTTVSADGTHVPYAIIKRKDIQHVNGLLVVGYGAYGSTTAVSICNNDFYPLLKRGWAVAYAFIRGGGDVSPEWAEAARKTNRHKSIEDFEAVIAGSQKKTYTTPENTVIFGRSAGGFLVGATLSRNIDGNLFKTVFSEVPYVDPLRTTTNPRLPLTIGEYEEFGNPLSHLENFASLIKLSPVNTLPSDGAPNIFVLCRTGLLDKQVFAYEPFKWIQRLRGNNEGIPAHDPHGKYIAFDSNEGHVFRVEKKSRFRALDLSILLAHIENKI